MRPSVPLPRAKWPPSTTGGYAAMPARRGRQKSTEIEAAAPAAQKRRTGAETRSVRIVAVLSLSCVLSSPSALGCVQDANAGDAELDELASADQEVVQRLLREQPTALFNFIAVLFANGGAGTDQQLQKDKARRDEIIANFNMSSGTCSLCLLRLLLCSA